MEEKTTNDLIDIPRVINARIACEFVLLFVKECDSESVFIDNCLSSLMLAGFTFMFQI